VLGIQRGEKRITAPAAEELMKPGDVLFVIGNRESIARFQNVKLEKL
jgi:monovalent cation:H+ antiporter-2, CPA2 family